MRQRNVRRSQDQIPPSSRQRKGTALESSQPRILGMMRDNPRMARQRKAIDAIHGSPAIAAQRRQLEGLGAATARREDVPAKPNNTGLPDNLKNGIEALSGVSMDTVRVHYNSSQPAQLNALAYAQGTDIHVGPGQEKHLPHEAWHVVQQAQGRVRPTMQTKGARIDGDSTDFLIQRKETSFKAVQEGNLGQRLTPQELWNSLVLSHSVFKEIFYALDAQICLRVIYDDGGERLGQTDILHKDGLTRFCITIYWPNGRSYEQVAATFLHEVLLHVVPSWQHHQNERNRGTLSEGSFPTGDALRKLETLEHGDVALWEQALRAGLRVSEGVVRELLLDAVTHLETGELVKLWVRIGMPEQALYDLLGLQMEEDEPQDGMEVLDRLEDAKNRDWTAGSEFRIKGVKNFYCRVTTDHRSGDLLVGHLTYVFR